MTPTEADAINEALDRLEDLTEWENEFILDLAEIDPFCTLTEKQTKRLEQITEKLENL